VLLDTATAVPDEAPPNKLFVTWPTVPPEPTRLFTAVVPLMAVFVTDVVAPRRSATVPPFTPGELIERAILAS